RESPGTSPAFRAWSGSAAPDPAPRTIFRPMDRFHVEGPGRLEGEVSTAGAKNAALPCLAATLLTAEPVTLTNLPDVRDIRTMQRLLQHVGVFLAAEPGGAATIEA